jgi:sodium-dependent dicarboxylate transporter 2/3/5
MEIRKKIGFILGPAIFLLVFLSPLLTHNPPAHHLLAIFSLIVIWWVTESIPIPITALLIPVFLIIFRITSPKEAFAPFAHPIIMLFLGSFILAEAMRVHGLDRKLASLLVSRKSLACRKSRLLLAVALVSTGLSLWVSNTATTAMMFPLVLGLLSSLNNFSPKSQGNSSLGLVFLLTIAYAASIGGIGTPIGSPPNLIAMGMMDKFLGYKMTFFQWMLIGLTILIPMFFILYFFMKLQLKRGRIEDKIQTNKQLTFQLAPGLTPAQRNVLIAFSVTISLWIGPGLVALIAGKQAPLYQWFEHHLPESVAAIIGASLLFFLPTNWQKGQFTLSLKQALRIDWGTLLLFGGGLSLGSQIFQTGLAKAIGHFFIPSGESISLSLITLITIILSVLLTEVTSNTASANMIIPIVIAISQTAGINPFPPVIASAIACSFAFLLPVATPPNAIIFGSGLVPLPKMIKYGFWLEIAGIVVIFLAVRVVLPLIGII